jgi:polysaccharide pyruvyl transferase WcaK-like protein
MRILITGLTLHNNKGGPALALSLIDKLRLEFTDAKFYLSVPNHNSNLILEEKWAKIYRIEGVIGAVGVKELLHINTDKRNKFLKFLKNIDLVVDLNALSYMDLPSLSYKKNLVRNLSIYTIRGLSNQINIPMIRWTQSYGPFSSFLTKKIVQKDLSKQHNIFARGSLSLNNIKKIFPHKSIFSFPDIAITLHKKESYYNKYLKNRNYITLSPSSVIYGIDGDLHIEHFRKIITYILKNNYEVVMVPHTLMSINPSLDNCDLKVSEKILSQMDTTHIHLVKDDLDVYELKGIISQAKLHIGARYHSIIASLSTGVPTIAFSWHEKYMDIMKMYQMEKYVYHGKGSIEELFQYIQELDSNHNTIVNILKNKQTILESEIEKNIVLFMENVNDL